MRKTFREWKPTEMARKVFTALQELGGEADTTAITKQAKEGHNTNGVSVSLGALHNTGYVKYLSGKRNQKRWKIIRELPEQLPKRRRRDLFT